jgi:hypothetical protein
MMSWRKQLMALRSFARQLERETQIVGNQALSSLRESASFRDPKCLVAYGSKVYSQNDEDGIIREIFNRIGTTNKTFVEFGVGNGLENNTYALLFENWTGLWIDGNKEQISSICNGLPRTIASGALTAIHSLVSRANINAVISSAIKSKEIDLLSVDIDGNDFHVFDAIDCVLPRVVVIEYNAKFPPPIRFCIDYDESNVWHGDDCFGASLKFLELEFRRKGYCLVGCNLTGANAFFVRQDLVLDKFMAPFSAETHFQPPRYYLAEFPAGHKSSYRALENSLAARAAP